MATYPTHIASFATHNAGDTVSSADPNTLQGEIVAIESALGTNPHVSTTVTSSSVFNATSTTYASLSARIANVEAGITGDSHTQYVHKSGGDTISPGAATVGLTIQGASSPTANLFQVTDSGGTPKVYVDSSYVLRAVNSGGTVVDANQTTSGQGTSSYLATADHNHRGGIQPCLSSGRPGSPFVGMHIFETDTNLLRVWNGTEWWALGPNSVANHQVPSGGFSTTSTSFVNLAGNITTVAFTKRNTNSTLRVWSSADAFVTGSVNTITYFAVKIGATAYQTHFMDHNALSQHLQGTGAVEITGIAAGAVTLQPQWKISGSGTGQMDFNGHLDLVIDEY